MNKPDLTNEDSAYEALLNGGLGGLEIDTYISQQNTDTQLSTTHHLPNAVDFGSEDELAEDEDDLIHGNNNTNNNNNNALFNSNSMGLTTAYMDESVDVVHISKEQQDELLLRSYFPDFKKGIHLNWNKLIYRTKNYYKKHLKFNELKPLIPLDLKFLVQQDSKHYLNNNKIIKKNFKKKGIKICSIDDIYYQNDNHKKLKIKNKKDYSLSKDLLIATDDWNLDKLLGQEEKEKENINTTTNNNTTTTNVDTNNIKEKQSDWNWNEDDLINAKLNSDIAFLDRNDENLLLIYKKPINNKLLQQSNLILPLDEKNLLKKFNISNDDEYKILKKSHQSKIRSTISNLNIEHSKPAIRLQSPFYKVNIPRTSLRFFHRPNFGNKMRPGTHIVFSKLKNRKRKRDKGKDVKESFSTTQDLTIGDSAPVYLMEYSEQTPISLSKFGMANKLINYYRKLNDLDTSRPKLPIGETHVLGVQDKSPFWNFGFVDPGHIVPTLYNNMFRAPIFKHEISGTDFLLIRSSGNGINNRFYLKHINNLFTVGQTLPIDEIPGPNSRKITSMRTTRLRMIVHRILNRSTTRAVSIDPIAKHFPDQDYGQNRQKVKEFMKYQRDGIEKGLWKLKDNEPRLDSESIRKLITPEQITEMESMGQGVQFKNDNELYNFDDRLLKLEENLLPWNSTKNFINATQMRAMLQIHGIGDPTGCGEGFSFLKTSMKGGFVRDKSSTSLSSPLSMTSLSGNPNIKSSGHTYNVAQQQKIYDEEIRKTWYTHAKSLSIQNPFEELDDPDEINPTNQHVKKRRDDGKVLKIMRKKRDSNGIIQRETIIIKDPRIIQGYLKSKEMRNRANLDVEKILDQETPQLENENDLELQKKLLQNELANLQKSKQRRQAKKKETLTSSLHMTSADVVSPGTLTETASTLSISGLADGNANINTDNNTLSSSTNNETALNNKDSASASSPARKTGKGKNTTRRCATCGQVGHIRTNKSCPMYKATASSSPGKPL